MGITLKELVDLAISVNESAKRDHTSSAGILEYDMVKKQLIAWGESDQETRAYIETNLPVVIDQLKTYAETVRSATTKKVEEKMKDERKSWEGDRTAWEKDRMSWEKERQDFVKRENLNKAKLLASQPAPSPTLALLPPANFVTPTTMIDRMRRPLAYLMLSHAALVALLLWAAVRYVK